MIAAVSRTKRDWASVPFDIISKVLELTGDAAARYAGVCTSWRRAADEPAFRRTLRLACLKPDSLDTRSKVLSFATFVCARPPVTQSLQVLLADDKDAKYVRTALAPVLVHLAHTLRALELDPLAPSDAFTMSPAATLCKQLQSLRVDVRESLDVRHLHGLVSVDLLVSSNLASRVLLPHSLRSCAVKTDSCVSEQAMRGMVDQMRHLSRLTELRLDVMAGEADFQCSVLPASVRLLELIGDFRVILDDGVRLGPELEAFCLHYCATDGRRLVDFLEQRCTSLRGLELARMHWEGDAVTGDLTHLPLSVVALLGAPKILLPASVLKAGLGHKDLKPFLEQPVVLVVEELVLDLGGVPCLRNVWPASLELPRLRSVEFQSTCAWVASQLGQRCPRADLRILDFIGKFELATTRALAVDRS